MSIAALMFALGAVSMFFYMLVVAYTLDVVVMWSIGHRRWLLYGFLPLLAFVMWLVRHRKENRVREAQKEEEQAS